MVVLVLLRQLEAKLLDCCLEQDKHDHEDPSDIDHHLQPFEILLLLTVTLDPAEPARRSQHQNLLLEESQSKGRYKEHQVEELVKDAEVQLVPLVLLQLGSVLH